MGDATKPYEDWWKEQAETDVLAYRWQESRIPFIDFVGDNRFHIEDAEYAWEASLSVFTTHFRIWNELSTVVDFAGTHKLHKHWNHTLSAIVQIGWRLHTWTPEVDGTFYRAFVVFVRPT